MKVICTNGHEISINFKHFNSGVRCALCKKFKKEEYCREVLEKYTGQIFPKTRPGWLINPNSGRRMELDGYSEVLNMAFEYDGEFHFKDSRISKRRPIAVDKQKVRDSIKDLLCERKGTKLIRIPYHIDNLEEYIKNQVDKI